MTTKLHKLAELGQSIWLDYIKRSLMQSGELAEKVQDGLRGMTSNPAIFEKAIANSDEYDEQIQKLSLEGKSAREIYEQIAIDDIRMAAGVLRPVYDETKGDDGYISLEVNPHLAHDRDATVAEAKRLFEAVNQPNVMIKVPATAEGLLAIQELIEAGVNVNVTLMFSMSQYDMVAEAYISALEKRAAKIYDVRQIASVASFFVSRIDVKVDKILETFDTPRANALKGKIGIANAKMAYQHFKKTFQGKRWDVLADKGARLQRVLYGSTSTKNPDYSDVMYVNGLIGPNTVNTIPPKTLEAFMDHGRVARTLDEDVDVARVQLEQLEKLGVNLDDVTRDLLDEGVDKFVKPYDKLIETIAEKQAMFITA
ncbi:MAG: transaldolase [Anaerolineales bacterium]|jgi:transaldolase